jgi:hypothetical protein
MRTSWNRVCMDHSTLATFLMADPTSSISYDRPKHIELTI